MRSGLFVFVIGQIFWHAAFNGDAMAQSSSQREAVLNVRVQVVDPCSIAQDESGKWQLTRCAPARITVGREPFRYVIGEAAPTVQSRGEYVDVTY